MDDLQHRKDKLSELRAKIVSEEVPAEEVVSCPATKLLLDDIKKSMEDTATDEGRITTQESKSHLEENGETTGLQGEDIDSDGVDAKHQVSWRACAYPSDEYLDQKSVSSGDSDEYLDQKSVSSGDFSCDSLGKSVDLHTLDDKAFYGPLSTISPSEVEPLLQAEGNKGNRFRIDGHQETSTESNINAKINRSRPTAATGLDNSEASDLKHLKPIGSNPLKIEYEDILGHNPRLQISRSLVEQQSLSPLLSRIAQLAGKTDSDSDTSDDISTSDEVKPDESVHSQVEIDTQHMINLMNDKIEASLSISAAENVTRLHDLSNITSSGFAGFSRQNEAEEIGADVENQKEPLIEINENEPSITSIEYQLSQSNLEIQSANSEMMRATTLVAPIYSNDHDHDHEHTSGTPPQVQQQDLYVNNMVADLFDYALEVVKDDEPPREATSYTNTGAESIENTLPKAEEATMESIDRNSHFQYAQRMRFRSRGATIISANTRESPDIVQEKRPEASDVEHLKQIGSNPPKLEYEDVLGHNPRLQISRSPVEQHNLSPLLSRIAQLAGKIDSDSDTSDDISPRDEVEPYVHSQVEIVQEKRAFFDTAEQTGKQNQDSTNEHVNNDDDANFDNFFDSEEHTENQDRINEQVNNGNANFVSANFWSVPVPLVEDADLDDLTTCDDAASVARNRALGVSDTPKSDELKYMVKVDEIAEVFSPIPPTRGDDKNDVTAQASDKDDRGKYASFFGALLRKKSPDNNKDAKLDLSMRHGEDQIKIATEPFALDQFEDMRMDTPRMTETNHVDNVKKRKLEDPEADEDASKCARQSPFPTSIVVVSPSPSPVETERQESQIIVIRSRSPTPTPAIEGQDVSLRRSRSPTPTTFVIMPTRTRPELSPHGQADESTSKRRSRSREPLRSPRGSPGYRSLSPRDRRLRSVSPRAVSRSPSPGRSSKRSQASRRSRSPTPTPVIEGQDMSIRRSPTPTTLVIMSTSPAPDHYLQGLADDSNISRLERSSSPLLRMISRSPSPGRRSPAARTRSPLPRYVSPVGNQLAFTYEFPTSQGEHVRPLTPTRIPAPIAPNVSSPRRDPSPVPPFQRPRSPMPSRSLSPRPSQIPAPIAPNLSTPRRDLSPVPPLRRPRSPVPPREQNDLGFVIIQNVEESFAQQTGLAGVLPAEDGGHPVLIELSVGPPQKMKRIRDRVATGFVPVPIHLTSTQTEAPSPVSNSLAILPGPGQTQSDAPISQSTPRPRSSQDDDYALQDPRPRSTQDDDYALLDPRPRITQDDDYALLVKEQQDTIAANLIIEGVDQTDSQTRRNLIRKDTKDQSDILERLKTKYLPCIANKFNGTPDSAIPDVGFIINDQEFLNALDALRRAPVFVGGLPLSEYAFTKDTEQSHMKEVYQQVLGYPSIFWTFKKLLEIIFHVFTGGFAASSNLVPLVVATGDVFTTLMNGSDIHEEFSRRLSEEPGLFELMIWFVKRVKNIPVKKDSTDVTEMLLTDTINLLYNCSMLDGNRKRLQEVGAVDICLNFLESPSTMIQRTSLLCVAYLADEKQSEIFQAKPEPIKHFIEQLQQAVAGGLTRDMTGWTKLEIIKGLGRLCVNDSNKRLIADCGAIDVLLQAAQLDPSPPEKLESLKVLWSLCFDKTNKELLKNNAKAMAFFEQTSDNDLDPKGQKVANGILWTIRDSLEQSTADKHTDDQAHIMISYQWGAKQLALKLRDTLKANGYNVWMDVDHMQGSTIEAMAKAVEMSAVFLMCMSQKYKESQNCRSEAEYAYYQKKDIVPIVVKTKYKPDGWLGFLRGTKTYYDVTIEEEFKEKMKCLIKALGNKGKMQGSSSEVVSQTFITQEQDPPKVILPVATTVERAWTPRQSSSPRTWSTEEASSWMETHGINTNRIGELTGRQISFLHKMKRDAPDFYYSYVNNNLYSIQHQAFADFSALTSAIDELDESGK